MQTIIALTLVGAIALPLADSDRQGVPGRRVGGGTREWEVVCE